MEKIKLSKPDLAPFLRKSNWAGAGATLFTWGLIAASLALVARWPHPLTVLLAIIVLGGRQLALGVLMHDCAHQSLFRSRALNDGVGQWLCAYPLLSNLNNYWKVHAQHHLKAGTSEDPDLPNYQAYPVSRASLGRKIFRDLSGQTGIKILLGTFRSGKDLFNLATPEKNPLRGPLLFHALMLLILLLAGHPLLYLLWIAAYLTTYMLFARIRQIAEHGAVPDLMHPDPRLHTRSTLARPWERLLLAPHHVHYHLEHHLFASVPPYRLKALHQHLKAQGVYEGVWIPRGYAAVLRHVTRLG